MTHLLLIDDDDAFLSMLSRVLQRKGLSVSIAASPELALEIVNDTSRPIDGIVLDLNLGGCSGLKWIPTLREKLPDTPILVLTGYASITTAVDAIKLGATQYLAKPADADSILAALQADSATPPSTAAEPGTPMSLKRLTWEHLQRVLNENDGNVSATARALNMHRRTLQRMLSKRPVAR